MFRPIYGRAVPFWHLLQLLKRRYRRCIISLLRRHRLDRDKMRHPQPRNLQMPTLIQSQIITNYRQRFKETLCILYILQHHQPCHRRRELSTSRRNSYKITLTKNRRSNQINLYRLSQPRPSTCHHQLIQTRKSNTTASKSSLHRALLLSLKPHRICNNQSPL